MSRKLINRSLAGDVSETTTTVTLSSFLPRQAVPLVSAPAITTVNWS